VDESISVFAILMAYKVCVLFVGLAFAAMGYRLFLADKTASAGDLSGSLGKYTLSVRNAAPGVFFSLFGTALICVSLFRGVSYEEAHSAKTNAGLQMVLPAQPPR
jgi:hypothetical protein